MNSPVQFCVEKGTMGNTSENFEFAQNYIKVKTSQVDLKLKALRIINTVN